MAGWAKFVIRDIHPLTNLLYWPRVICSFLGGLSLGCVFYQQEMASINVWGGLVFCALLWPHLIYVLSKIRGWSRAINMYGVYQDAINIGFWVCFAQLVPVVALPLIIIQLSYSFVLGGMSLLYRSLIFLVFGAFVYILTHDLVIEVHFNALQVMATLPIILAFIVIMSIKMNRLSTLYTRQRRELRKLSRTDRVSGLYNRSFWEEHLGHEYQRSKGSGFPCSLVILSVDHFEEIVETSGVKVCDQIIQAVTETIRFTIRPYDIAGRFNSDAFSIILPHTRASEALMVADRLRQQTNDLDIDGVPVFSLCAGVTELTQDVVNGEQWVARAEQALSDAKKKGQNQSYLYEHPFPVAEEDDVSGENPRQASN